ncbi:hypothetical protein INR49_031776 [Caranx melampygus]|nr:hypothetical protein INR49_031776 [Caranx melampygus]
MRLLMLWAEPRHQLWSLWCEGHCSRLRQIAVCSAVCRRSVLPPAGHVRSLDAVELPENDVLPEIKLFIPHLSGTCQMSSPPTV